MVNDTVGTLMACSSIYRDCQAGVILGTGKWILFTILIYIDLCSLGTNACYFENLENVPKWTDIDDNQTKRIVINTEWGALGKVRLKDFY